MGRYGLLGEKLGHSYSKLIHESFGGYEYDMFPMPPEAVEGFMRAREFSAINVTIPYKEKVMPFLDTISDNARGIGSVNTVVKDASGALHGYNTDKYGFMQLTYRSGIEIQGRKCLILGSGGSSKMVRVALREMGAREVRVISRSGEDNYTNLDRHADAQIIVNTTPVGMYPNNGVSPIDLAMFPRCEGVLDIIYNPAKTALLLEAERRGLRCANGLHMLVAQAKLASELFRDVKLDDAVIDDVRARIERDTHNIVLIGMPGSGKTTLGRLLAARMGRRFIDTDEMIPELSGGRQAGEVIRAQGENEFRCIETEALSQACKQSGCVIATGGGVVTQMRNADIMRQNSVVFFIDRPLDMLEVGNGRPLSATRAQTAALYAMRRPLYEGMCDVRVENIDLDSALDGIMGAFDAHFGRTCFKEGKV